MTIAFAVFGSRITPARAGKTASITSLDEEHRDHPRSCGKDAVFEIFHRLLEGSPPLVRERLILGVDDGKQQGITPARAGKTVHDSQPGILSQDHPRSCGKDATKVS